MNKFLTMSVSTFPVVLFHQSIALIVTESFLTMQSLSKEQTSIYIHMANLRSKAQGNIGSNSRIRRIPIHQLAIIVAPYPKYTKFESS